MSNQAAIASVDELSGIMNLAPSRKQQQLTVPLLTPPSEDPRSRRLTQLNEKWSESGAVTHKFRISHKGQNRSAKTSHSSRSSSTSPSQSPQSPFYRQPSPSQHQELARALLRALDTGGAGHRMSVFGPFIREVPGRIGHNAALDAAVACLVHAHSALVHQSHGNEIANPQLYLRAVQTLQMCLENEGRSANTLCACVMLGLVEVSQVGIPDQY
jgi:hypothetical protein